MITRQEAVARAYSALSAATTGDTGTALGILADLAERSTDERMYDVHAALAGAGEYMLQRIYGGQAPDIERGGTWTVELLHPGAIHEEPHVIYAVRFLVALANRDRDTCRALYQAAVGLGADHLTACTCQLLGEAAHLTRRVLDGQLACG